jgi:hypothetical protein
LYQPYNSKTPTDSKLGLYSGKSGTMVVLKEIEVKP